MIRDTLLAIKQEAENSDDPKEALTNIKAMVEGLLKHTTVER